LNSQRVTTTPARTGDVQAVGWSHLGGVVVHLLNSSNLRDQRDQ
jgi:hypothetical protein